MSLRQENKFFLKSFVVGPMAVNCYLLADPSGGDACIIDPGADAKRIANFVQANGFNLKFIINTHGHGDHIAANGYFDKPIYIHRLDKDFLTDTKKNLSSMFLFKVISPGAGRLLEGGDRIRLGALEMEIIHTPGHTPGSISIKVGDVIFTGDCLFAGGIGRTDFSYGDEALLLKSIKEKLFKFDDATVIYPGHGGPSTIGTEKGFV